MSPKVVKFIRDHKKEINNLEFASLHESLVSYCFSEEVKEFWQAIKKIYKVPYNEIIPGYEKYIDLDTKFIEEPELDIIEKDCSLKINLLPNIKNNRNLYATLITNFSNSIDTSRFSRYIDNDPIEPLDVCELLLDREGNRDQVVVSLRYKLKTNHYRNVVSLKRISYDLIYPIPGLCVGYSPSKINSFIQDIVKELS